MTKWEQYQVTLNNGDIIVGGTIEWRRFEYLKDVTTEILELLQRGEQWKTSD